MNHPRLLVATEFPSNASGGGPAVVRQMLKGWPVDKLYWWSCRPDKDQRFGQNVAGLWVAAIPPRLYPEVRLVRAKSWIMEQVWARWAARHLQSAIREFQPEVIWGIPHAWAIPPMAAVLPHCRVGVHLTVQDYMTTRGALARYGASRAARFKQMAETLYAQATTRDATSHPMIEDLLSRTGQSASQMLHAGLEADDFIHLAADRPKAHSEIRIGYAGTILVEREFAFFVSCLDRVRAKLGRPVSLELWGAHTYQGRPWFNPEWMREHGNLPERELSRALRECTWGFSPMALADDDAEYNRFSFPTKFISYLAAGLPIITLGHPESSVAKMAAAYQVGLLQTRADAEEFSARLFKALSAANPAWEFRPEIIRCAREQFDAARMRAVLHECFRTGAARQRA